MGGARGTCRHCGAQYSGKQNHCQVCHQTFATERGGDSHRLGPYEPPGARFCAPTQDLASSGMWVDKRGIWHGRRNEKGVTRRPKRGDT